MAAVPFLLLSPLACGVGMIWSIRAACRWTGVWRWLALVPIAALLTYVLVVLVPDSFADSTSHNLLPFELGIYFWPSLPYMALLAAIQRFDPGAPVR